MPLSNFDPVKSRRWLQGAQEQTGICGHPHQSPLLAGWTVWWVGARTGTSEECADPTQPGTRLVNPKMVEQNILRKCFSFSFLAINFSLNIGVAFGVVSEAGCVGSKKYSALTWVLETDGISKANKSGSVVAWQAFANWLWLPVVRRYIWVYVCKLPERSSVISTDQELVPADRQTSPPWIQIHGWSVCEVLVEAIFVHNDNISCRGFFKRPSFLVHKNVASDALFVNVSSLVSVLFLIKTRN